MFVILEWNQASGRPSVYGGDVYYTEADADVDVVSAREDGRQRGRRETYTVHELEDASEPEGEDLTTLSGGSLGRLTTNGAVHR